MRARVLGRTLRVSQGAALPRATGPGSTRRSGASVSSPTRGPAGTSLHPAAPPATASLSSSSSGPAAVVLGELSESADPAVVREAAQRLRFALEVGEGEVWVEDDGVLAAPPRCLETLGQQRDGGGAARALHGAGQRRLVDEADDLVTSETLEEVVLVPLAAHAPTAAGQDGHARQAPECVAAVLRAPALAVGAALLMVGHQAASPAIVVA